VLNAVAEITIAFQYHNHSWMLRANYIELSASTAIGLFFDLGIDWRLD